MTPETTVSIEAQIEALRSGAGVCLRPELLTLKVSGPDRIRYLNGMLTNDVAALNVGEAHRSVKTTHKGKVQGLLRVRAEAEALLVDVLEVAAPVVAEALLKLLIMDDATLSDATPERTVLSIQGVNAAALLAKAGYGVDGLAPMQHRTCDGVSLIRDDAYGVPGYEVHLAPADSEAALSKLLDEGGVAVSPEAIKVLRVEAGVPIDGDDLHDTTIPLEARLESAISFTKGCYLGQEVIARAHNLGGVKHILVGLQIEGDVVPEAGAEIFAAGVDKATGEVTSPVFSPSRGGVIALGYVRVAHQEANTALRLTWSGQETAAHVVSLPFVH